MKYELEAEYVRSVLSYCAETGILTWLPRSNDRRWTGRYAGKIAGMIGKGGYVKVKLRKRRYLGHHLAWLIETGTWPRPEIDHKNGICSDNRLSNIRLATRSQNVANRGKFGVTSSSLKGVSWHKATGKWQAQIVANGKKLGLGVYATEAEAHAIYMESAVKHYGEFARAA